MSDHSLAFFMNVYNTANKNQPKDSNTGGNVTQTTVQYNVNNYDKSDPSSSTQNNNQSANYNVLQSAVNSGQYVNYQGNSTTNSYTPFNAVASEMEDLSYPSIIDWTKKYKAMSLSPGNFAYLTDFGTYPANHLMVLRRYNQAISNDLFTTTIAPLYTMCTWYNTEKIPVKISFNEEWKKFDQSFMSVLEDIIGIKIDSIPGIGSVMDAASGNPLAQDIFQRLGQSLGIITSGDLPYGDPNMIYESAIRAVNGEDVRSGLKCDISVEFEARYIQREIGGLDSQAAMMMVIAEAVHMGTSNSRFYVTGTGEQVLFDFIKQLRQGNADGLFQTIKTALSDLLTNVASKLMEGVKALSQGDVVANIKGTITNLVGDALKNRYQRYRWQLIGVVGALTGAETAPWHVTLGNPKSPWFMCGNMVLESAEIELTGELGYTDMPTELVVKYRLKNGRALGAGEITALFNKGKGRIYDTPDSIQNVYIPDGTNFTVPGQQGQQQNGPTANNKNAGASATDNSSVVNTSSTNSLSAAGIPSTGFALNNQSSGDPNIALPSGNTATSFIQQ